MTHRNLFRALVDSRTSLADALPATAEHWKEHLQVGSLLAASLFQWRDNLFLYFESPDPTFGATGVMGALGDALLPYPAQPGDPWVRMMDIFHYGEPASDGPWQRSNPAASSKLRINRLRPGMYASYIFYHYQLQEEYPGIGDRYGIIGVHDDLIAFYDEEPPTVESGRRPGRLTTRNSPRDRWQELMQEHFQPWEDTNEAWRLAAKLLQAFPLSGVHTTGTS
jgi:hypothetical protein